MTSKKEAALYAQALHEEDFTLAEIAEHLNVDKNFTDAHGATLSELEVQALIASPDEPPEHLFEPAVETSPLYAEEMAPPPPMDHDAPIENLYPERDLFPEFAVEDDTTTQVEVEIFEATYEEPPLSQATPKPIKIAPKKKAGKKKTPHASPSLKLKVAPKPKAWTFDPVKAHEQITTLLASDLNQDLKNALIRFASDPSPN